MPLTGSPITLTSPELGGARPVTRLSVVDFPHPVGPTTATNSPRSTLMLKLRSAVSDLPEGDRNRRLTLISSIAGEGSRVLMTAPVPLFHGVHEFRRICLGQVDLLSPQVLLEG